ncbi:dynamin-1-like protein [Stylonychia lemnae]|uniref:Dynamin-1-like protein n=1 Tax=Stylonychia lemnae TaxID=5949 RepID=A0A077ZUK1_STYLE|nr:dynamin-1-like protein [Stylonychia lemnae]|eukprot:CDW73557.1 dynamin-1-like protein [Stylonychia lemnae]
MEKLIPLINKLQEVFSRTKVQFSVNLPQIVVVGGQSSGKSSVLESIVGLDFLPRGTNIVTRRPIIIQLTHTPYADKAWAEFTHRPNEKYFDFSKVKEEIDMDTNKLCGTNKDISPTPILLKIYSRSVVDLTLVDLPGITKIPTGDQPHDIELRIADLINKFITPKTAIIMAVCAANVDLANSDALKMARRVDPLGERTIGVITKIDLMDEGTNALDLLSGKVYPLKLGYVGVVCRSQKDILNQKTIEDALKSEEKFFKTSSVYYPYSSRLGVNYLAHNLNMIIVSHIKKNLPEIRSQITCLLFQKDKELRALQLFKDDSSNESQLILNVIAKFAAQYSEFIEGKFVKETASELMGGSRLSYIFYEVYNKILNDIDPFDALTDEDLKTAIRNASSLRPNLFVPEMAFEVLSKQQILRLESPSLQCVQLVYEELRRIVTEVDMPEFSRFQNLRKKIIEIMYQLLTKSLVPCNQMVKNLILIEDSYINTYHPDFMGGATAIFNVFDPNAYAAQQAKLEKFQEERQLSFEEVNDEDSSKSSSKKKQQQQQQKQTSGGLFSSWFGGNPSRVDSDEEDKDENNLKELEYAKYRNDQDFEINKYMQKNIKPVHLPNMPSSIRATKEEMSQNSPRSQMEIHIIKNLITSYFNIVRKNLNDLVPKTVIAMLVNKTKNQTQRELVQQIYNGQVDLKELLVEDLGTVKKREACAEMVKSLKQGLEYLNEVRDFYFDEEPIKLI